MKFQAVLVGTAALMLTACATPQNSIDDHADVLIGADGSFIVDGVPVSADRLSESVEGRRLLVRADPGISYDVFRGSFGELEKLNVPIALVGEDAGSQ